jgi:drug/metabolite transporter (DMT)-like permease
MPVPDGHRYLPSSAVFLVELLKLAICLTLSLYEVSLAAPRSTSATSLFSILGAAIFTGDSWQMAIPAFLYTLANSLQYIGITNLDAATFQVTYQLKIIVTAIFSVSILKRSLNARQWVSLLLLMVGVAIVSLPQANSSTLASSHHSRIYIPRSMGSLRKELGMWSKEPNLTKRSATYEGIEEDEMALNQPGGSASAGLLAVLGVTICSGLAGVYFEKVIKDSPKTTSLWVRNVQLSVYSLFPAFFIGVLFIDGETVARNGFFDGYNWVVVLSIAVQSFGGIVAAFCIYYADNISKNFAVSISMVLSSLASFFFFDFEATGYVGCAAKTMKETTLTSNSSFLVHRSCFSRPTSTVCKSMPVHDQPFSEYTAIRTSQSTSLQMKRTTYLSSCRRRP